MASGVVREFAPPLAPCLDEATQVPAEAWLAPPWELQLDPRVGTTRGHTQPRVLGRVTHAATGRRETVYGLHGPCPTPLRHPSEPKVGDRLIRDPKGPGIGVRPLTFAEYQRLKGVPEGVTEGGPNADLRVLLQAVPIGAAMSALHAAYHYRSTPGEGKAGVGPNPEEDQVWAKMQDWLRAWRMGHLAGREDERNRREARRALT